MKNYCVYATNPDSSLHCFEIEEQDTSASIDAKVGGVNWFGTVAISSEDAISKAQKERFAYRDKVEMDKLKEHFLKLGSIIEKYQV